MVGKREIREYVGKEQGYKRALREAGGACYRLRPMGNQTSKTGNAEAVPVEWGAVRALAMVVGVREAARRMLLSEEAVKKRCTREGWLSSPEAREANKAAVTGRSMATARESRPQLVSPMSPANLILAEISQLGGKTRLSIARGVSKAAEHVENMQGSDILDRANDVKAVAQTADLVHGWKDAAPNVKIRLDVLNGSAEQPIIEMEAEITDWQEESCDVEDY